MPTLSALNSSNARSQAINEALAEFFVRKDAGESIDKNAFLASHPSIAEELLVHLQDVDAFTRIRALASESDLIDQNDCEVPTELIHFGGYEVVNVLGSGGMGDVYLAVQKSMERNVAIKFLRIDRQDKRESIDRFLHEAKLAGNLRHPNIVCVYDVGDVEGRLYYSMEYVEGRDLEQIARSTTIQPHDAARIIRLCSEAIQYAHDRAVLHRDIKPSNILIDRLIGDPHITDFGLAKHLKDDPQLTQTGQLIGTPYYMAPEQTSSGMEEVTVATDVYSLGATLYFLLTGVPPFLGKNAYEILRRVREDAPSSPSATNPAIEKDLDVICLKCLHKNPTQRYSSALELAEDLKRYEKGQAIYARPRGLFERTKDYTFRYPALASLLTLLAILSLASPCLAIYFNSIKNEAIKQRSDSLAAKKQSDASFDALLATLRAPRPRYDGHDVRFTEVLDSAVEDLEKSLSEQPVVLARLLNELAQSYHQLAEQPRAISTSLKSVTLFEKELGPDDRQTLDAMSRLANHMIGSNDSEAAVAMNYEVVERFSSVYGPRALETLRQLNNLAGSLVAAQKSQEAKPLVEEAIAFLKKSGESPDIIQLTSSLAAIEHRLGNKEEAASLFEEIWQYYSNHLTPDDPVVLNALGNLVISRTDMGKPKDGIELGTKLFEQLRKNHSEKNILVIDTINRLAYAHQTNGEMGRAAELYGQALRTLQETMGDENPRTLTAYHNVGFTLERCGPPEKAIPYYTKAAELCDSPSLADTARFGRILPRRP